MACIVRECRSHSSRKENCSEKLSFHTFPKNEETRRKWFDAIHRSENQYNKYWKVCSRHFAAECFVGGMLLRTLLRENAVPTLNLPPKSDMAMNRFKISAKEQCGPSTGTPLASTNRFKISAKEQCGPSTGTPLASTECLENVDTVKDAVYKGKIEKLEKRVQQLELQSKKRLLKLNALKQRTRRLKTKNSNINLKLIELLEKEKIDKQYLMMLECVKSNKLIERFMEKQKGSVQKEYSLELKKFAVTLHYLSPKAYSFVREELKNVLPHPSTISKWYRSLDCNPGFTKEALDALKERVAQNNGKPILCALSMDEMAIRKIVEWDGSRYFGYANVGCDIDSDDAPLAKEALTFMVTALNDSWKIPVGYFLLSNITSQQKALLVEQCLSLLSECGVTVVSLTFDGAATNKAMCSHLMKNGSTNSFDHEGKQIYFWPDPCHNIKLIRNAFADKKTIIDGEGQKISWHHIELLHDLQKEEGLHLATKLRDEHVHFVKQKMKVRLATQLLSQSVADALKYCQLKEIPGFENCGGTIKFIKTFNDLFDIMNSRSIHSKGLKRSANPSNIGQIKEVFSDAEKYINSLRFEDDAGLAVVHSNRSTGFRGFLTNMVSLLQMYHTHVEMKKHLKYVCTYKLSQDHLELFFGAVRSRCGYNNNPSARMFRAAYKKLLVHAELKQGATGNCIPLEQIPVLNASNFNKQINESTGTTRLLDVCVNNSDATDNPDHDYIVYPGTLSEYSKDVVHYIAGFVVRNLKKQLKCEKCLQALEEENERMSLLTIKDRGGLTKPSKSVTKICETAEKVLREMEAKVTKKSVGTPQNFAAMLNQVTQRLLQTDVLKELHQHSLDNYVLNDHRHLLLKSISQSYFKIRIHHITKQLTVSKEKIRSCLTKTIIFKGQ